MQIDRSNYEIWLTDWLDGNLTDIQADQLHHFMEENPDLKEEYHELVTLRLSPSDKPFPLKNHLKKTTTDLSEYQLEYLSVAYLENDLSASQKKELKESIEIDPEKQMSFDLMQKMKLFPVFLLYKHKKHLLRRTVIQNVIRLSLLGLSAAAIITLVVISYVSKPKVLQVKFEKTAQINVADSTIQRPAFDRISNGIKPERKIVPIRKYSKNFLAISQKTTSGLSETNLNQQALDDSLQKSTILPRTLLDRISFSPEIDLKGEQIRKTLVTLNFVVTAPEYDDARSRFGKFIARTFREKILKEKTAKDSPLKIYEIAEAGVAGLDKLLG
ncbi:MAG: hypothetical protein WA816_08930, partial [Bacteroidales bacterium]